MIARNRPAGGRLNHNFKREQIIEKYLLETGFSFCRRDSGNHLYPSDIEGRPLAPQKDQSRS